MERKSFSTLVLKAMATTIQLLRVRVSRQDTAVTLQIASSRQDIGHVSTYGKAKVGLPPLIHQIVKENTNETDYKEGC
jgi:hypothetical protein